MQKNLSLYQRGYNDAMRWTMKMGEIRDIDRRAAIL